MNWPARFQREPRVRQDWVHEHAETGKPPAPDKLPGARGRMGPEGFLSQCAVRPGGRGWRNGPALVDPVVDLGMDGHKISAQGSDNKTLRPAGVNSGRTCCISSAQPG